jgi:hypothetical protein
MKTRKLFIDQYGNKYYAKTIKELKTKHYLTGRVSKMYRDDSEGNTYHVGYVIGSLWLTMYEPVRKLVK